MNRNRDEINAVNQIKIGQHIFGIVGLKNAFEEMAELYADRIAKYKVRGTPALLINDRVMSTGTAPSKSQIKKWLEDHGGGHITGEKMDNPVFIKNIKFAEIHTLVDMVDYEEGRIVSRTFAQNPTLSITLFAFDKGEEVGTHTAPGDAMIQVLDGEACVNIDGKEMVVGAGQVVVMPADIPHSVSGVERFKMLLTVAKYKS